MRTTISTFIFLFLISVFTGKVISSAESGKEEIKKDCYECHKKEKEAFSKGEIHEPVENGNCSVCHKDHGDGNNLVLQAEKENEICYECHDSKSEKTSIHKPIREGNCSVCHDPHVGSDQYRLKKDIPALCFSCHNGKIVKSFLHTPFREGKCMLCHDPHESNNDKLIKLESGKSFLAVADLCLKCHPDIIKGKSVHLTVLAGECDKCHSPHSTDNKAQLLEPPNKICYQDCHETYGKNKHLHKPVEEGKCISCHDPHNSPNDKLLLPKNNGDNFRLDKLCYLCHPDMRQRYIVKIHNPISRGRCDGCHLPHFGENKSLLEYKEDKDMCLSCHELVEVEDQVNKRHRLDKKHTKCLKCHGPHGK